MSIMSKNNQTSNQASNQTSNQASTGKTSFPNIKLIKVNNMKSSRNGQPVKNQFLIKTPDGCYFQSYSTIVVFQPTNPAFKVAIDTETWWNVRSVTTGKYRNIFLRENKSQTQAKIDSGEYELADLN